GREARRGALRPRPRPPVGGTAALSHRPRGPRRARAAPKPARLGPAASGHRSSTMMTTRAAAADRPAGRGTWPRSPALTTRASRGPPLPLTLQLGHVAPRRSAMPHLLVASPSSGDRRTAQGTDRRAISKRVIGWRPDRGTQS